MPLEEVSFYNLVGGEVNLTNLVTQMINHYNDKLEIGETKITDFNEGSEIRNILEAYAILAYAILEDETEASRLPFIRTSYAMYLDRIGENPFINLPRVQGASSEGSVVFTLATVQENDVIIPADTLLETDGELEFVTIGDCTIPAGDLTSDAVGAECLTEGADGNIRANSLVNITEPSIDTSLISVNNPEEFINGADYEDDEEYRERLLANIRADGFGTISYYETLGNNVDGVHDVALINDSTYTKKVLVNGYSKPTPDDVLLDVLTEFTDVNKKVLNHNFIVSKPTYVTVDLTVNLEVTAEVDDLDNFIRKIVDGGMWDRFEFNGLYIGENLTAELIINQFEFIGDVVSADITGFTTTDIGSQEVVKLGTVTVNQTVVG